MNKKLLALISFCSLIIAFIAFAYSKQWFIITVAWQPTRYELPQAHKKTIRTFFAKNDTWKHEDAEILWDIQSSEKNLSSLVQLWLTILAEEHIVEDVISVEYIILHDDVVYLSLNKPLFSTSWSIHQKLTVLDSFFKTIKPHVTPLTVYFLVDNKPMIDAHLDFSQGWRQAYFN